MAIKKTYEKKTTPKGTLAWAFLTKPAKKYKSEDKEYKTDLILDPSEDDVIEFIRYITEKVNESVIKAQEELKEKKKFADAKQVKPKLPYKAQYDEEGNETGLITMTFKTNELTKDGKKKSIGLFDSKAKPINPNDISIGAGTVAKVNFSLDTYYNPVTKEAGIKPYLNAVQIIELVSFGGGGGDASLFGFGEEEGGFEASSSDVFSGKGAEELDGETSQDEF